MTNLIIRDLGLCPYQDTLQAMQHFTLTRDKSTPDELWILEHPPVFTAGLTSKEADLLNPGDIPVVKIDRGGQVTYHGPGQLIAYTLLDLSRLGIGVKALVAHLEQTVINLLGEYGVNGQHRDNAPGVYVDSAKIASLGLRIKKSRCYHGLSLNVAMDLEPFQRIVPCGLHDVSMTQLRNFSPDVDIQQVKTRLIAHITQQVGYNLGAAIFEKSLPDINPS